jgi:hypothetical protein
MTPRSIREFRTGIAALSAVSLGTPPVGHLALLRGEDERRSGRARAREATAPVATTSRSPATPRTRMLAGLVSWVRAQLVRSGPSRLAQAAI